jgi:hypothetical protein
VTTGPLTRSRHPVPGILALTVLLLGAVLLSLGAAHAICAATMTHLPGAVSTTMAMEDPGVPTSHASVPSAVAPQPMPWMADGPGDCMIGAGLLCVLVAALIAAGLRTEHAWSAARAYASHPWLWPSHLPAAAAPSLTVLSISRT